MKLLFKILVALFIGVLGFGCFNKDEVKDDEGEENTVKEEEVNNVEETVQPKEEEVEEGYNIAREFSAFVTIDGFKEELFVIIQSNKAGDESIVLVVDKSHSETRINEMLYALNDREKTFLWEKAACCLKDRTSTVKASIELSTGTSSFVGESVAIVGNSVGVLTGGIKCSSRPGVEGECGDGSNVQEMVVKGLSKNEKGIISGVILGKEGEDNVVAELELNSGKDSKFNLARYKLYISNINDPSFCSQFTKEEKKQGLKEVLSQQFNLSQLEVEEQGLNEMSCPPEFDQVSDEGFKINPNPLK